MTRELSQNAKTAIYAQETSEVFITLVTINHEDFTDPIRICNDPYELLPIAGVRGVVSRDDEYVFLPFNINLPIQDDTGLAKATFSVDNVSREIVAAVRGVTSSLSVTIEIVLASDVNTPEITVPDFKLEAVTYDALTVQGDLTIEYYELEPIPSRRFTPSDFPGLF